MALASEVSLAQLRLGLLGCPSAASPAGSHEVRVLGCADAADLGERILLRRSRVRVGRGQRNETRRGRLMTHGTDSGFPELTSQRHAVILKGPELAPGPAIDGGDALASSSSLCGSHGKFK